MSKTSGLSIRQFERHGLEFQAELVIADSQTQQVRFSSHANTVNPQTIRGKGVDLSVGGAGLECRNFVPRLCSATLRVFGAPRSPTDQGGQPIQNVIFEHPVRVRRVQMLSNSPTYGIGLAFVDPEPGIQAQVDALKAQLSKQSKSKAAPGGSPRA